ncbi:MAG: hypothetical protein ACRYFX_21465 [Janthinobacterium lividum]
MPTLQQTKRPPRRAATARRTLLQAQLVRETLDGRPLYYAGYQAVLAGRKTVEEIMGSSSLQWVLVSYFMRIMLRQLDEKKYWFATNEAGVHLDHRDNLAHDVAIYEKATLPPDQINTRYVQVPAKVVVEIDVRIDMQNTADSNYVNRKIRKLLEFGTERIIWIFTDSQQVLVAERGADAWLTMDWHRDLELLDGQRFNVGRYLQQEGISAS